MLQWDAKEQREVMESERRRQKMRDDLEFSGDDDSVLSDDGEEVTGGPSKNQQSSTALARQRLRQFLPQPSIQAAVPQRPHSAAVASTASPKSHRPKSRAPQSRPGRGHGGLGNSLDMALEEISRQLSRGGGRCRNADEEEPVVKDPHGEHRTDVHRQHEQEQKQKEADGPAKIVGCVGDNAILLRNEDFDSDGDPEDVRSDSPQRRAKRGRVQPSQQTKTGGQHADNRKLAAQDQQQQAQKKRVRPAVEEWLNNIHFPDQTGGGGTRRSGKDAFGFDDEDQDDAGDTSSNKRNKVEGGVGMTAAKCKELAKQLARKIAPDSPPQSSKKQASTRKHRAGHLRGSQHRFWDDVQGGGGTADLIEEIADSEGEDTRQAEDAREEDGGSMSSARTPESKGRRCFCEDGGKTEGPHAPPHPIGQTETGRDVVVPKTPSPSRGAGAKGGTFRSLFASSQSKPASVGGGGTLRAMFSQAASQQTPSSTLQRPPASASKRRNGGSGSNSATLPPPQTPCLAVVPSQGPPFLQAGGTQQSRPAPATRDVIADFSDEETVASPKVEKLHVAGGRGGGANLERKTSWLTRMKSSAGSLPASAPGWLASGLAGGGGAGGGRRRKAGGRLESALHSVLDRLDADRFRFRNALESNSGLLPLKAGEEGPWCAVVLGDAFVNPNFWLCRVRVMGLSGGGQGEDELDIMFNVTLRHEEILPDRGRAMLIYQPWTIFSLPGCSRPCVLCGDRVSSLPEGPPDPAPALPATLEQALSTTSLPSRPALSIADLPILPLGAELNSDGSERGNGEIVSRDKGQHQHRPVTLIKAISPWSCEICIRGHVLRSCLRSSLLASVLEGESVLPDGPEWAVGLLEQSLRVAKLSEPVLYIVDSSDLVIELLVPLPLVVQWSSILLEMEGATVLASGLSISSSRRRPQGASVTASGARTLGTSPHVLELTQWSSIQLDPQREGVRARYCSLTDAADAVFNGSSIGGSLGGVRATVQVRIVDVVHPDPANFSGHPATLIVSAWDASLPSACDGVCVAFVEPFLCVSCAVNVVKGDAISLTDVLVVAPPPHGCNDDRVVTLVVDALSGVSVLQATSRANFDISLPATPPPYPPPLPVLPGSPSHSPLPSQSAPGTSRSSFVPFHGVITDVADVESCEACPLCYCTTVEGVPDGNGEIFCTSCERISVTGQNVLLPLKITIDDARKGRLAVEVLGKALREIADVVCPDMNRPIDLERALPGRVISGKGYWWWTACWGEGGGGSDESWVVAMDVEVHAESEELHQNSSSPMGEGL